MIIGEILSPIIKKEKIVEVLGNSNMILWQAKNNGRTSAIIRSFELHAELSKFTKQF